MLMISCIRGDRIINTKTSNLMIVAFTTLVKVSPPFPTFSVWRAGATNVPDTTEIRASRIRSTASDMLIRWKSCSS